MRSIRGKILLCMTLTVVISLTLVGSVSIYLNYSSTNDTLSQTMFSTASVAAERVSQQLEVYKTMCYNTGGLTRLANPGVSVGDKKLVMEQRAASYGFQRGNLLEPDGDSLFDGNNYADRDYFQHAMQGETFVSEPLVSKVTGEVTVIVAAPLWKDGVLDSSVVGVVYFVPRETFLNDIVSSVKVSENGSAYILSKDGYTIAHRNMDNVKNRENTQEEAKTDAALSELAQLEQGMTKGEEGFGQYTYGGVKKFLAYAPIPNTDGWSIGINAPVSDFSRSTTMGVIATVVLIAAAALCAVLIAVALANRIGKPMEACAGRLEKLARGDLKSPVPQVNTKDETRRLAEATGTISTALRAIVEDIAWGLSEMGQGNFNVDSQAKEYYIGDFTPMATAMYQIMNRLTDTLAMVKSVAGQVAGGSDQVSSGAQALSQGATEQASSVQELAATVNEVNGRVQATAANAGEARSQVEQAGEQVSVCNTRMEELVSAMDAIRRSSGDIGKIIKTIEDIAFQTNILALNAAVEAARAGAAGKGFAVVADEVRNLASKSAEASKNTVHLIEDSMRSVENGTQLADETAEALLKVVDNTRLVNVTVKRIAQDAEEQSKSLLQVTQGIDQISAVVQTNSATSQESAAASEELSSQAQILKDLVGKFQLPERTDADIAALSVPQGGPALLETDRA